VYLTNQWIKLYKITWKLYNIYNKNIIQLQLLQTQLGLFPFDQQTKNFINFAFDIRTWGHDSIKNLYNRWRYNSVQPNSDYNAHTPSSLPEYADLPLLADHSDDVQNGHISTVALLSEKTLIYWCFQTVEKLAIRCFQSHLKSAVLGVKHYK